MWIQQEELNYTVITEPPDPSGFYTHRVPSCSPASGVRRDLCFLWPQPESGPQQREMDLHTDCAPNSFQSHVSPGLKRASCAHMAKPNSKGDEKNYHLTGSRTIWRITSMMGFPGDVLCQCRRLRRRVSSLGWEDSLEEGMATHSRILA